MVWYWFILAVGLLIAFHYVMKFGSKIVERRTGRSSELEPRTNLSDFFSCSRFLSVCFLSGLCLTRTGWLILPSCCQA